MDLKLSKKRKRTMDLSKSISNQTDVALRITKQLLLSEGKESNVVYSQLPIQVVLSLIAAGSKGPTLEQLLSFLNSKSIDNLKNFASEVAAMVLADRSPFGGPSLNFVYGVWLDKSLALKPSFKEVVENSYKAALTQVDFQNKATEATNKVNSWSEKETNGLIKEILPHGSVDNLTRLIFANALYFKGAWNQKFKASATKEYDFHLLNGKSVKVPFMTSKKDQFVRAFDGFKVLQLPYKKGKGNNRFSMYFFLPDAKNGLAALVEKMCSESMFLDRHIYQHDEQVEVGKFRIPRFKMSFGFEASNVLKGLGLELPFSAGGDLTEMVDSLEVGRKLYVSSMFHKSFIEVNEEGTEAAAASAAVVKLLCYRKMKKIDFVADHPFLFLIREDLTGTVLFIGHVLNPLAG